MESFWHSATCTVNDHGWEIDLLREEIPESTFKHAWRMLEAEFVQSMSIRTVGIPIGTAFSLFQICLCIDMGQMSEIFLHHFMSMSHIYRDSHNLSNQSLPFLLSVTNNADIDSQYIVVSLSLLAGGEGQSCCAGYAKVNSNWSGSSGLIQLWIWRRQHAHGDAKLLRRQNAAPVIRL